MAGNVLEDWRSGEMLPSRRAFMLLCVCVWKPLYVELSASRTAEVLWGFILQLLIRLSSRGRFCSLCFSISSFLWFLTAHHRLSGNTFSVHLGHTIPSLWAPRVNTGCSSANVWPFEKFSSHDSDILIKKHFLFSLLCRIISKPKTRSHVFTFSF